MKSFKKYISELNVPRRFEKKKRKARKRELDKISVKVDLMNPGEPGEKKENERLARETLPGIDFRARSSEEHSKKLHRLQKKQTGERRAAETSRMSRNQRKEMERNTPTQAELDFAKRHSRR